MARKMGIYPNDKSYHYELILYPDNPRHSNIIKNISVICTQNHIDSYYMILHDKDVYTYVDYENYVTEHDGVLPSWNVGDKKKIHYHCYISLPSQRYYKPMFKDVFHFEDNELHLFKFVRSIEGAVLYLTHRRDKDKFQYSEVNIITNNQNFVDMIYSPNRLDDKHRSKLVIQLELFNDWLSERKSKLLSISDHDFLHFCVYNGCTYLYKSYHYLLSQEIFIANEFIEKSKGFIAGSIFESEV